VQEEEAEGQVLALLGEELLGLEHQEVRVRELEPRQLALLQRGEHPWVEQVPVGHPKEEERRKGAEERQQVQVQPGRQLEQEQAQQEQAHR
jgi:hypothetical protein